MTPAAAGEDDALDVFTVLERLLPGAQLTPSQLAQVRAANVKLQTELFELRRRARATGRAWTEPSPAERSALLATIEDDVRSLLTPAQRAEAAHRAGPRGG